MIYSNTTSSSDSNFFGGYYRINFGQQEPGCLWGHTWQRFTPTTARCLVCGIVGRLRQQQPGDAARRAFLKPYALLGLQPGCGIPAARKAYHKAAMDAHPDRGGSHDRAVEINKAWEAVRRSEK